MKTIVTERLIDSRTGEPFVLQFEDDYFENVVKPLAQAAWEAGARMRKGLQDSGIEILDEVK
jgi:hypothetical protein